MGLAGSESFKQILMSRIMSADAILSYIEEAEVVLK